MRVTLEKRLTGRILDIGGGGEGVIGRLYGSQVTAIDIDPGELEEAPGGFEKVVMDAADLTWPDGSFDHVTAFYSLLFMTADRQKRAMAEAARVLKPGGRLCLWDCRVDSAWPEPFLTGLTILLPEETITATYSAGKPEGQRMEDFLTYGAACGLKVRKQVCQSGHFYLEFLK